MARWALYAAAFLVAASCTRAPHRSVYVDSAIEAELRQVHAIDNHAHPKKVVSEGEEDHDYDALSMEGIGDIFLPAPFSADSAYFPEAWHALFGYDYADRTPEHMRELAKAKSKIAREKGDQYPAWVLNRANTDIMLANRVAMGRGLTSDRFRWVPFVDMFIFPLNNDGLKAKDPDHRVFLTREEQLLSGYLESAQMRALPATFDEYTAFVSHRLETWKAQGAVAVKFELAYLRTLEVRDVQRENAERVYSIYARGSEASPEEYKILQDYMFHHIAQEAGRLGMPVHIHCALGAGSYFRAANGNPIQLDGVFNDPSLRKTKFVMLHGGWPYAREAAAEIWKPNVYLDISAFMYFGYPVEAARAVRIYLETAPEKVLYGSDASPISDTVGWEETTWIGSRNGRLAVGLALTGMLQDGEITSERAKQIAHMVMRENARQLYGF
ncbi:MAG: amidohydrolase family protein [Acidobacteriaceae bacterium]|nr:amidohydrolase family protein [Acidobacteriaceae bacterium]